MSRHTKGPWHLETGEFYCAVRTEHQVIANMWFVRGRYNKRDATLITAAPELLEALRGLRDAFLGTSVEVQADAMRAARAAIAKAGGEV